MKIFLTRPCIGGWEKSHNLQKVMGIGPSLGLAYLSSYLKLSGHSVRVLDGYIDQLTIEEIVEKAEGSDIVGINCMSVYYSEVVKLSRKLKEKGILVVIGGPHATVFPEATLQDTQADYVVAGEGEEAFQELLECLAKGSDAGKVAGVLSPSGVLHPRSSLPHPDSLPFPDWEEINPLKYTLLPYDLAVNCMYGEGELHFIPQEKMRSVLPIISSRGCIQFSHLFPSARVRSPANFVEEIRLVKERFGVEEYHVEVISIADQKYLAEICELLQKSCRGISWGITCEVRPEILTPELSSQLRRSGCIFLGMKFETPGGGKEKYWKEIVDSLVREGIMVEGYFRVGMSKDWEREWENILELVPYLPLDKYAFGFLEVAGENYRQMKKQIEERIPPQKIIYEKYDTFEKAKAGKIDVRTIEFLWEREPAPLIEREPEAPSENTFLVEGRINFSDGTKPRQFETLPDGMELYLFDNLKLILSFGVSPVEFPLPVVVDRNNWMSSIAPSLEKCSSVDQLILRQPGYKEVIFRNLPVCGGKVTLPDLTIHPCGEE